MRLVHGPQVVRPRSAEHDLGELLLLRRVVRSGAGLKCPGPAREIHALTLPADPLTVAIAIGWADPEAAAADPRAFDWDGCRGRMAQVNWETQ